MLRIFFKNNINSKKNFKNKNVRIHYKFFILTIICKSWKSF